MAFLLALSLLCTLAVQTAFAVPAAADYKFEGGSVTVDGTEDKTVDVNFISVKGDEYFGFQADWSKKELEDTSYFTLTALTPGGTASPMENDPNTGHTYWTDGTFDAPITVVAGGTIWKASYTVAKNTPSGTYTFSLKVPAIVDGSFDGSDVGTYKATVTVTNNTPAAKGYTVAVSGDATIQTGEEAQVKLNITHSDTDVTSYAAYSMKVNYNKDVLTYKDKSFSDADATVTDDGNGTLTIYRYGKDLNLGEDLTLTFTGKAGGTSEVKVTEAKVDEAANANMQNAPAATVTGSAAITVGQTYNVNRDTNVVDGNSKAEAGKDYTFKLANGLDGKYMDVKYTVGGVEKTLTANADGSYTIPKEDVTGDITITAVGHEFTVTVTGTGAADVTAAAKATYDTDYTFTLNKADNYAYTVTVTAGGKTVTSALDADGKTYTINGKDITGNVVITVIKTANAVQINFTGSGSADVVNGTSQTAEPGKDFTFTITKEDGYEYTVTAVDEDATERFPAILFPEQLQEAAQRRSERKSAVQITEAQKELRRLCNGRPSAAVESQVLSMLNCLVAAPEQIKPQPRTVNRGELAEMERRFSAALTTSPVDEGDAKELALRLAGMQYSTIGSSEYESQRLRHLFTAAAPMAEIDAELLKSAVSQIYVKKGQTSLLLKNGQIIERSA